MNEVVMAAEVKAGIDELLEKFQQLPPEAQNQFLEQAKQVMQGEDEATAQARAFLESRGLPVPHDPLAIRQKAAGIKLLEEIKASPRQPLNESKLSEHDRVLYGQTFGDHE
jgi:hypothetical protein